VSISILHPVRQDAVDSARQEYKLAQKHYRIVCGKMSCLDPKAQELFQEADRRRARAFERYIRALQAQ
jgi:hypothetical protein